MNNNKHIHDEDYDFSIKLMIPLLSTLVCTICLCATTWAWYTASVSTGVTSITARANISETVTFGENNTKVDKTDDGGYKLNPGVTYTLSFQPGDAENGYYALIDLDNSVDNHSNTASIVDLFINRIYADESEAQVQTINNKGYFYINKSSENLSFPIIVDSEKVLKIQYVWGIKVEGSNDVILEEKYASYHYSISTESGINLLQSQPTAPATITFNYIDATTGKPLPYSVLDIESYGLRENEEDLPQTATIVYEANGEEIEIFAPEGYLLEKNDSFNEKENVESRVYRIETDEDVVINVSCVQIPQDTSDDIETENVSESDNDVTDITPPVIENNSDAAEKPDTNSSDVTDQNSSTEIPNADEINQFDTNAESSFDKPIESLLITDTNGEGTTETTPSSDETNSETDDVSE